MNKNAIGKRIRADKAKIIEMYEADTHIIDIAKEYGVVESTIHRHLRNWGVPLKRGAYRRRKRKVNEFKRKFSEVFLARQAENTRINNMLIKHCEFEHSTEDQLLVSNIIQHPILG